LTVRRLIPSRRAISRCATPSADIARTCAHSTALRTPRRLATAVCVFAMPASASAATRVVNMGTPPGSGKAFEKTGSDADAFFPSTTTIHVGESVRFLPVGFHNLDLPKKGGKATALVAAHAGQTGANDAAGAPYWFNGQPVFGFNLPALAPAGFGKTFTYTDAKGVQSGLPLVSKPRPVTVKFAKTGTCTYYCDVHAGMKGTVKVLAKSIRVPSARADLPHVARDLRDSHGDVRARQHGVDPVAGLTLGSF
jgi:plastocyanin